MQGLDSTIPPDESDSFSCTEFDIRNGYLHHSGWSSRFLGKGCPVTFRAMLVSSGLLAFVCLSGCECAQQRCRSPQPVCDCETETSGWVAAPSPNGMIEDAISITPSDPSVPPPAPGVAPESLPETPPAEQPKPLPAPATEKKVEREANARPAPPLFITP